MENIGQQKAPTANAYIQTYQLYQARNCHGSPLRGLCHNAKGNRTIKRNHELIRLRAMAKELLTSKQSIAHRKRRCWDIEAVFGNIKQNMYFKYFFIEVT